MYFHGRIKILQWASTGEGVVDLVFLVGLFSAVIWAQPVRDISLTRYILFFPVLILSEEKGEERWMECIVPRYCCCESKDT